MISADYFDLDYDLPENLPYLGIYKVILHCVQILIAFLILFLVTPIISAERHYYGSSQASPNYVLVITLKSLIIAFLLALFPWTRLTKIPGRLKRFFVRPRTNVIFTAFLSIAWFIGMISMTVDASDCSLDAKLEKEDSDYKDVWLNQCRCAKATAGFSWIMFFAWLATTAISVILLWHEKRLKHERAYRAEPDDVSIENEKKDAYSLPSPLPEPPRVITSSYVPPQMASPPYTYTNYPF
ncbi:hypothetical protein G6F70_001950 [Rhizopus microsporus]|uniref:MARVEL domain-containing protein n=1 Tax=Rhizopus microsporus TaxID=58291 RepID=A0A1X0SEU5_RHIZD|nr:hypothetical protein G6F71_002096 [Rhizopus microsporus]KAG1202807.1 hypothetical protein G6F70_001950 [Rhizopus microsporus]KAG1214440.1 hypothetical protein G6F69_001937 [Rhizopus microsporus]KAG1237117.1 hypothetical protein G6F67_001470 [Rhizopus microsporus]KAG1263737.1 hypothetical protein G6F68_004914 [Rhizopus microsporus]